jgi:hypothetical protein
MRRSAWAATVLAVIAAALLAQRRTPHTAESVAPTPAAPDATLAPSSPVPAETPTPAPPVAPSPRPRPPRDSARPAPIAPATIETPPPTPAPSPTPVATPERTTSPTPSSAATPVPDGALLVLVTPWADVTVDGEPRGQTPLARIPLAPGPHDVRLGHPDYAPFPRRVVIRPGETFRLVVDLATEGVRRPR